MKKDRDLKKLMMLSMTAILFAALPLAAATETVDGITWTYTVSGGKAKIYNNWSATIPTSTIGSITIPSALGGKPVTSIGDRAFAGCGGLTSVTIPDSVTSIGSYAFYNCSGLTSVTIPDSVMSIGQSAFSYCSGLTNVTIPDSLTSIGQSAFSYCNGLTNVTIPDNVTSIGAYSFSGCSGLTRVTIPDSVTSIGDEAFCGCGGLTSVTIPNSVTSIGNGVFSYCWSLTSVTIPQYVCNHRLEEFFNFSVVTNVVISDGVTSIGDDVFRGCSGLTSVMIPDSVVSIGNCAFYNCSGLTRVTIPDSVTSIGNGAFSGCNETLYDIHSMPGVKLVDGWAIGTTGELSGSLDLTNVRGIGYSALGGCYISRIIFNGNAPDVDLWAAFGYVMAADCVVYANKASTGWVLDGNGLWQGLPIEFVDDTSALPDYVLTIVDGVLTGIKLFGATEIIIPTNVTSIGDGAFEGCSDLTSVTIPDSVTSIGDGAFRGCSGLTSVMIGNSVMSIAPFAFSGCSEIRNVTVPQYVCTNSMSSVFPSAYRSITNVVISDSVTSIGDRAFLSCNGLTRVTIPDSVTSIGDRAFYDCNDSLFDTTTISGVKLADGWAIGTTGTPFGHLDLTGIRGLGSRAFFGCDRLTRVTIPDSVTSIGSYAFQYCISLTSVTIPNSVTNIGYSAFYRCSGLTSVMIGNGVTSIGDHAFAYCSGLTNVVFKGNAPTVGDDPFYDVGSGCTAYIRNGSTGWGVEIPGVWKELNIQYLTSEVEIAVANEVGDGTVEIEGELPEVEVASGVTVVVKGENLDAEALAAKITPKPHEVGQDVSFFKVTAKPVASGISLTVDLEEDEVRPDETAAEIVSGEAVAAFGAAAEGENVFVSLLSAKEGLYYGIVAANDLSQLKAAAENVPLVQAGIGGVTVPVAKPAGGSAFFKVIVSDRAR